MIFFISKAPLISICISKTILANMNSNCIVIRVKGWFIWHHCLQKTVKFFNISIPITVTQIRPIEDSFMQISATLVTSAASLIYLQYCRNNGNFSRGANVPIIAQSYPFHPWRCTLECNDSQRGTTGERQISNILNAIWDSNEFQRLTISKSTISNNLNTFWDSDGW